MRTCFFEDGNTHLCWKILNLPERKPISLRNTIPLFPVFKWLKGELTETIISNKCSQISFHRIEASDTDLAIIDTEEKQAQLRDLFPSNLIQGEHWIGLKSNPAEDNDNWKWINNELLNYSNWQNNPNHELMGVTETMCSYVNIRNDFQWGSNFCTLTRSSVCQFNGNYESSIQVNTKTIL